MLLFPIFFFCALASGFNLDTRYPIIFNGKSGDYFGYSVALHRNRDGPLALIGAPRANSSFLSGQIQQPGALYRCDPFHIPPSCHEILLDKKGNTGVDHGNGIAYFDKKDSMWLGVSLDIQRNSAREDIVTCGHLWKNQLFKTHYLVNGVCYVINGELDTRNVAKLVPFVNKSLQAISSVSPGIYYYAFAQVGTSAAYSEDGKYLHLGAPGFSDWSGTVVSYNLDPQSTYEQYRSPTIPKPPTDQNTNPISYIGYAVSSGKFYGVDDNFVAVGAPRDGNLFGRVYIYKATQLNNKNLIIHQKKEGKQLGEYFGSVVLGMNVNNDAYTDLFVGAPFHTSTDNGVDEGKVYVYISNGMGLQEYAELQGKNKINARFGSAIANVGDLNLDGYNDVAIGAPYENEKGVIYIYHGSKDGINVQYVQRIVASEINPDLSGFGIQISKGFDIDNNQYPDILVGAYSSSNAVLFRTQPVIQLIPKVVFNPKQININVTNCNYQGNNIPCVNITACLWYVGKHVPMNLDFEYEILVEHSNQPSDISPRGFFLVDNTPATLLRQQSSLIIGIDNCITEAFYIRPNIKDVITPIQIMYRYNLIRTSGMDNNSGLNNSYPMIDPASPHNISSVLTFKTGCGHDDRCFSDLVLSANVVGNLKNEPMLIGKNSSMTLLIKIINRGEPAYLTELFIYLPPELPSINQDICSSVSNQQSEKVNATLVCDIGNPLLKDKEVKLQIKLDLTKIPTTKRELMINLEVVTGSNETNPDDNNLQIPLNFMATADISISGISSHEQIPYDEKIKANSLLPITHTYFIMNHGPSPISVIDFKLFIPTTLKGKTNIDFVTFNSLEADSGQSFTIPAKCNDTFIKYKPVSSEDSKMENGFDNDLVEESNFSKPSSEYDSVNNKFVLNENDPTYRSKRSERAIFFKRRDVVIDCDEVAECIVIECSASPFTDLRKFAKITMSAIINMDMIKEHLDPWYRIEYITTGEAVMREDSSGVEPKHQQPDRTKVKTMIVNSAPVSEKIAQWIIFVSIGVGILLLLIILILLIKFGFFKREQKEKMQDMKRKSVLKDIEGESTESEILN